MGIFDHKKDVIARLSEAEGNLTNLLSDLPEDWVFVTDIDNILDEIIRSVHSSEVDLKNSAVGRIDLEMDRHMSDILRKIERHTATIERFLAKVKAKKGGAELKGVVHNSMKRLADELHYLNLVSKKYPVNKIHNRKVLKVVLKGLRSGELLPPSRDFQKTSSMLRHFTGSELILAVQYNTSEKPYLMITLDSGKPVLHILKSKSDDDPEIKTALVVSKLMRLLGIRHMLLDSKHKLVGDVPEHMTKITHFKGVRALSVGRIKTRKAMLAFAFLMGAACADGFVVNLSDRPFNILVDYDLFKKAVKHPRSFLGLSNPIFHIDYDFAKFDNSKQYISSQFFSSAGGVFILMLFDVAGMRSANLSKKDIADKFIEGFDEELRLIRKVYRKNRGEVDALLSRNGLGYLSGRMSIDSVNLLKEIAADVIPKLDVPERQAA